MKEFKGTPFITDGTGSVLNSEGQEVCYVHIFKEQGQLDIARLFSLAPELLKELQLLIIAVENLEGHPMTGLDHVDIRVDKARAAIDKLSGE